MTDEETRAEVKAHRLEHIKALREMREIMLESENWENMDRFIRAVTVGAMAIERLNKEDFGEYEV